MTLATLLNPFNRVGSLGGSVDSGAAPISPDLGIPAPTNTISHLNYLGYIAGRKVRPVDTVSSSLVTGTEADSHVSWMFDLGYIDSNARTGLLTSAGQIASIPYQGFNP